MWTFERKATPYLLKVALHHTAISNLELKNLKRVGVTGETTLVYSLSMLMVGIGWNFMLVGGTTLLSLSYRDNELKKAQGLAETSRFVFSAISTSGSGMILRNFDR